MFGTGRLGCFKAKVIFSGNHVAEQVIDNLTVDLAFLLEDEEGEA